MARTRLRLGAEIGSNNIILLWCVLGRQYHMTGAMGWSWFKNLSWLSDFARQIARKQECPREWRDLGSDWGHRHETKSSSFSNMN